jgi:HEAT repeat protein
LDKLATVRQRQLSCFGSDSHGFRLNPPLPEEELRRFETAHGVELPACYRAFLLHAGNGGAGPYYGLFPLDKWNDFADWVLDEVPADFLARPSPLRPGWTPGLDMDSDAGERAAYQGTLSIGSQGCTYAMQLIVSGSSRGRVAYVDADGQAPFVTRDGDFLSWYERWLDELLNGYETSGFGCSPPGGEAELLAILGDAEADAQLKGEAAWAIRRLPRLSDPAAAQVIEYLRDPLADVRSGACSVIRRFALTPALERVGELLGDSASQVRREAVLTLMELVPDRSAEDVRQTMLREPDYSVASSALFRLKDAGRLRQTDLLHVIETSRLDSLRGLAVYYLDWGGLGAADTDLAIRLLNDPDKQVRLYAALGLRHSKLRLPAAVLIACLEREEDATIADHLLAMLGARADPAASPVLLQWATAADDFHRLAALEGLIRLGDERAVTVAREMLRAKRPPRRVDANGGIRSHVLTIRTLVWRTLLRNAPHGVLRSLARRLRIGS